MFDSKHTRALLIRAGQGDAPANEQLYALLESELRHRARAQIRRRGGGALLQTTAVVNEAWLRLAQGGGAHCRNRHHFLNLSARAMRSVLVDYARAQGTRKRGGELRRVEFLDHPGEDPALAMDQLLDLSEALDRLQHLNDRLGRVAEMRIFGGLKHSEIGEVLGISERSVLRSWRAATAWLQKEMT